MSEEEFLKKYGLLDSELYKLQKDDLIDRDFFGEHQLVDKILNEKIEEKQLKYRNYIKEQLQGATKERKEIIRKKIQQDYEEGEISKEFYISILKEFFGEREVFKAELSNIKDDSLEKNEYNSKNNTEFLTSVEKSVEIENRDI